jgi:hypothetical protein
MRLYKYKPLSNFEFVADILCRKRFYAAQFFELNDPMEGHFDHDPDLKADFLNEIYKKKMDLRFCSFSSDPSNILLWAHYADSFKGLCIEVEVPKHLPEAIKYSEFNVYVSEEGRDKPKIQHISKSILTAKNKAWRYEKEHRIFSSEKYIEDIKIVSVLLGMRMPDTLKDAIRRIVSKDIKVYETDLNPIQNRVEVKK